MKKTRENYERYLNNLYADCYGLEQVQELFEHFKCRKSTIINAYHNHTIGSLMRRHDPIQFNVGYGEWSRK